MGSGLYDVVRADSLLLLRGAQHVGLVRQHAQELHAAFHDQVPGAWEQLAGIKATVKCAHI